MHCVFALFGFDQGTKSIQTVFIKMHLVGNFSLSAIPLFFFYSQIPCLSAQVSLRASQNIFFVTQITPFSFSINQSL
jgi:hypothetical protein